MRILNDLVMVHNSRSRSAWRAFKLCKRLNKNFLIGSERSVYMNKWWKAFFQALSAFCGSVLGVSFDIFSLF